MSLQKIVTWIAFIVLAHSSALLAQTTTATLKGKVVDSDGAGLPGVPVTVTSRTHGDAKKTVMTDLEGGFKFQLLPPANDYTVSISYPGFAPIEVGPVDLDPGKTTVQNVTLHTQEEMTVHETVVGHGNVVDTESTKSSTTFNREFLDGLPIIGRRFQDMLTLTPGVTDTDGDGNPNVEGARATGLQIRFDGGNITDPVSGTFGQNLNFDAIEEIEVITAGASPEFGRADGGFANIVTKSGGNEFQGSFKVFWRGKFLDSDGATENNDTVLTFDRIQTNLRRTQPFVTVGGALKKDKVWYFASFQYLDQSLPLSLAGASISVTTEGHNSFAKLTWQVNSENKLALQYNDDPQTFRGLFLNFGTQRDSDATFNQGGITPQLRWTSILSSTLLLEALVTHFDSGIAVTPVSILFHETDVSTRVIRTGNNVSMQAVYPLKECSQNGTVQGSIPNCDPSLGRTSIYQINLVDGTTSGPFPTRTDDSRGRDSIKADLTYTVDEAWGEHQIKSGIEFANESFHDSPINNPFFLDQLTPCSDCRDAGGAPIQHAVKGVQILSDPTPVTLQQQAVSFNSAAYLNDAWKPRSNLNIQAGVRIDREDVDSSGFGFFDPRAEKRGSVRILQGLCSDAQRVAQASGISNWGATCNPKAGYVPGTPPLGNLIYAFDEDTPEWLRRFDHDEDGEFNSGTDGPVWNEPFTSFPDRKPESFTISNMNLSPRLSVSWDPLADGKSKIFSTWGRFYDRLFLNTVLGEIGPDTVNYTFQPDSATHQLGPGMISNQTSTVTVQQVDRGLRTPYTDVFTLGFEREIATEWSAKVTFTQRLAWDLLQDIDINHLLCSQYGPVLGLSPANVCPSFTDASGKVHLGEDLFGSVATKLPNGAPDLYNVNPNFNQILRVGNFNKSMFRSLSLEVNRRLHRNWQMQASYTYSRAIGDAESFQGLLGNDPSTKDDERGYLSFDQRHRVVLIAVSHLPRDIELGTTLTWEGGTPFSVIGQVVDADNLGNVSFRTYYPTGQRNDQRNGNFWGIDAQLVKRFAIGGASASAQFAVKNILNSDDLTLSAYNTAAIDGIQLRAGPQGLRRFGRFWELGVSVAF